LSMSAANRPGQGGLHHRRRGAGSRAARHRGAGRRADDAASRSTPIARRRRAWRRGRRPYRQRCMGACSANRVSPAWLPQRAPGSSPCIMAATAEAARRRSATSSHFLSRSLEIAAEAGVNRIESCSTRASASPRMRDENLEIIARFEELHALGPALRRRHLAQALHRPCDRARAGRPAGRHGRDERRASSEGRRHISASMTSQSMSTRWRLPMPILEHARPVENHDDVCLRE
jgi:hypothetical protein